MSVYSDHTALVEVKHVPLCVTDTAASAGSVDASNATSR